MNLNATSKKVKDTKNKRWSKNRFKQNQCAEVDLSVFKEIEVIMAQMIIFYNFSCLSIFKYCLLR